MLRVAIFISGTGRTLRNLIFHSEVTGTTKIVLVGATKECSGLQFARDANIPVYVNEEVKFWACEMACFFRADLICLAGYVHKVHVRDVTGCRYQDRVINVHPSLLPDFGGQGMYGSRVHKAVIESGVQYSGCTVHFCNQEYDRGQIILQRKIKVQPEWDWEELGKAVFEEEKIAYPIAIDAFRESFNGHEVDTKQIQAIAKSKSERTDASRSSSEHVQKTT